MLKARHWLSALPIAVPALALACSAGAASYTVAPGASPVAGPVVAGEQVAWVERRGAQDVLMAAAGGVAPRVVTRTAAGIDALTASGGRAVLARRSHAVALVDLATGATSAPGGCDPILHGDLLALSDCAARHGDGRFTMVDLASGARVTRPGDLVNFGGDFAALRDFDDGWEEAGSLWDWRTGARVRSVPDGFTGAGVEGGDLAAVAEDGTVFAALDQLVATAPSGPPVVLDADVRSRFGDGLDEVPSITVAAGGGFVVRHAHFTSLFPGDEYSQLVAMKPDGSGARGFDAGRAAPGSGWGMDGARVAVAIQPCARTTIAVWDVTVPPPAVPAAPCARPAIRRRPAAVRNGRLHLQVACAAVVPEGCAASFLVHVVGSAETVEGGQARMPAGTTADLALAMRPRPRALQRAKRFAVTVTPVSAPTTPGDPGRTGPALRLLAHVAH